MFAYHFLKSDMTAEHGNEPAWEDGESRTLAGEPVMCEYGYHASPSPWEALKYAHGPILCLVELGDAKTEVGHNDKLVSATRKLVRHVDMTRELRLFAADCAEAVLHAFESYRPGDDRPRKAVEAARAFARGEIDDAARSAAESAAWDAAGSAGSAGSAARSAARSAAWSAAGSAAWDAAITRQRERFNAMALGLLVPVVQS